MPTPTYCNPLFTLDPAPLLERYHSLPTYVHMSEEREQSLNQYSYRFVPVPHNQPTMDSAIYPAEEISQDEISMPPPAAHPAYYESHGMGYTQYYRPATLSDGATHMNHRAPCAPQPTIAPAQLWAEAPASADGPPFFDVPFGRMAENTPIPSGTRPDRTRQDFNSAGYNPAVPGTSMANINRDLALRFVNDPCSNFVIIRIESSTGRSRVMIELDVADGA